MKKIALFMPTALDGGVQRVLINLAEGFLKKGYKVDMVLSKATGKMLDEIPVECNVINLNQNFGKGDLLPILSIPKLWIYLKKVKPNLLIGCPGFTSVVSVWMKFIMVKDTKIAVMVDNKLSLLKNGKWYHRFTFLMSKLFLRYADKVIVAHKEAEKDINKIFKRSKNNIKMIYHPLIKKENYEKEFIKPSHPFMNLEEKKILAVGRLVKEKDFINLVRALKKVLELEPSKLIILGEGPERENIEKTAIKLGVDKHISLPGYVKNPYEYMKYSDLMVVSSCSEAFGNVIVEGLSMGIPIVSTDCKSGGPAEILNGGEYGLLCPCNDSERLADSMVKSLRSKHNKIRLIERSKEFTVKKSIDRYEEIINE